MAQCKVKLPREVAEAIEALRAAGDTDDYILWFASRDGAIDSDNPHWNILYHFVGGANGEIFLLADALRYGYIVDEPITLTIAPEQQDRIREFYEDQLSVQGVRANIIISTLNLLGITIPGVND